MGADAGDHTDRVSNEDDDIRLMPPPLCIPSGTEDSKWQQLVASGAIVLSIPPKDVLPQDPPADWSCKTIPPQHLLSCGDDLEDSEQAQEQDSTGLVEASDDRNHHTHSEVSFSSESSKGRKKRRKLTPKQPNFETTRFCDIVGHRDVKLRLEEILLPMAIPSGIADSVLSGVRRLPASVLLYGPPGCGKTQMARAVAGEARAAFLSIGPSDVLSKFVGESEASIRSVFARAYAMAREVESLCTVLFFDEIDAIGQARTGQANAGQGGAADGCSRRILAELLIRLNRLSSRDEWDMEGEDEDEDQEVYTEEEDASDADSMEGQAAESTEDLSLAGNVLTARSPNNSRKPRIIVIAASNRPEDCDEALLRRFGLQVYIGPPTKRDRAKILKRLLRGVEHKIDKDDMQDLVKATEGFSGSDLESLARDAAMAPVRECIRTAALLKKKARKQEKGMAPNGVEREHPYPQEQVKSFLLGQLAQLRPVTIDDFEESANFWRIGTNRDPPGPASARPDKYYSDSSSDEE